MDALWSLTNRRTVPQVFIKGDFIGGCDGKSDTLEVCTYNTMLMQETGANAATSFWRLFELHALSLMHA